MLHDWWDGLLVEKLKVLANSGRIYSPVRGKKGRALIRCEEREIAGDWSFLGAIKNQMCSEFIYPIDLKIF
jgi:hypothetical protein